MTKLIAKIALLINNLNLDTTILDITINKINLTYISKFELSLNIIQYIDSCLIFNKIYINNLVITSDIDVNS